MSSTAADAGLDRRIAYQCADFSILQTRWHPARHEHNREITTDAAAIEIMSRGSFVRTRPRERVVGDANSVVFFPFRSSFRISHSVPSPNRGTTIRIPEASIERCHAMSRDALTDRPAQTEVRLTPRARMLHARLLWRLGAPACRAAMEVESIVVSFLLEVLRDRCVIPARHDSLAHARSARVREYLSFHFLDKPSLTDLATVAGSSVWTVSRDFHRSFGITLGRHITQLRLGRALTLLRGGHGRLTSIALASGFCSHSHFTKCFRREFGLCPARTSLGGPIDPIPADPWN